MWPDFKKVKDDDDDDDDDGDDDDDDNDDDEDHRDSPADALQPPTNCKQWRGFQP